MHGHDILMLYFLEHDLAPRSRRSMLDCYNRLRKFLGHDPTAADFSDDTVNLYLHSLAGEGLSKRSLKGHRGFALTIWRWLYERGEVEHLPRRVKKIAAPPKPGPAWIRNEGAALLVAAHRQIGWFRRSRVSRKGFWIAFILVGWNCGLRLGDLLALRFSDIQSGVLVVTQQKTGELLGQPLWPETVAAIEAIRSPERQRIFGDALSRRKVQDYFKLLVLSAGLTGTSKWLRRSGATSIEIAQPGSAMAFLGHKTPGLAYKHYVDLAQVQRSKIAPPPIVPLDEPPTAA